jgi:phosphohistidine phosphatase
MKTENINRQMPDYWYQQSGVVPYRITDGEIEILLITSRSGKKWIIPKGIIEDGLDPIQSAEKEALEEAGIEGNVHKELLGKYKFKKWGGRCKVQVFPMEVKYLLDDWDEKDFRERKWYKLKEAKEIVKLEKLKKIMESLQDKIKAD